MSHRASNEHSSPYHRRDEYQVFHRGLKEHFSGFVAGSICIILWRFRALHFRLVNKLKLKGDSKLDSCKKQVE